MLRLGLTTAYILVSISLLTGCSGRKKDPAPVENIKLGDLAPLNPASPVMKTRTISFDFYKIDLPVKNIRKLSEVCEMLYTRPIRLNDPATSAANHFRLVYGESRMWDSTAEILQAAGGKETGRISMQLDYGQVDDLIITRIREQQDIFYFNRNLEIESVKAELGHLILKVDAAAIPGERGICDLNFIPALKPREPVINLNEPEILTEQTELPLLGFTAQMSPDSFILICPASCPQNKKLLSHHLFIPPRESNIRIYVVFCRSIID